MASDYGLNFGFLRSDESTRVTEGRYKTPVASTLRIGTCVEVNQASAGYLKASAANAAPITAYRGLLLQELEWDRSIYLSDADALDSFQYGVAKADRLSIVTNGAGTKVWMKNTGSSTRADGRVIAAVAMFDETAMAGGIQLGWDGTLWAKVTGGLTEPHMQVLSYDSTAKRLEAVLIA